MNTSEYQTQLQYLWGKVGLIVHLSQMIEYTLSNILAFDEILREYDVVDSMCYCEHNDLAKKANQWYEKLKSMTMGNIIAHARRIKFFTEESEQLLAQINSERYFIIHNLLKEDLFLQHIDTNPAFYFPRLEALIDKMYNANAQLNDIFKQQKTEYRSMS